VVIPNPRRLRVRDLQLARKKMPSVMRKSLVEEENLSPRLGAPVELATVSHGISFDFGVFRK
jgi:hypothetical protein